ncbi:hypothetical protein HWV62_37378 [Athelia sp. TMB]|nr:hypothetical protein HWV62_37378 [Athelia sp. TMB]
MAAFLFEREPLMKSLPLITPEKSATSILDLVDTSTREKDGGKFLNYDGTAFEW